MSGNVPILELDSVTKKFGNAVAVDRVSLKVERNEFLTLLGPSGCGKTSTLRLISGVLRPDGGRLLLNGELINDLPVCERDIGMVFQSYALFPHMTVTQNVGFGLRMRKVEKKEKTDRVREALSLVHLDEYGDRYPEELSGGQQQRVAIARALVIRPSLLLMDEPMSSLDALLRVEMQFELRRIIEEVGVTTINVTHNQEEALSMSDRVAVMSNGCIEQEGAPYQVYNKPVNEFVGRFLGRANIITCKVEDVSSDITVGRTNSNTIIEIQGINRAIGDHLLLQVRPEAIEIGEPHGEGPNNLLGEVVQAAFVGAANEYLVEAADNHLVVRAPAVGTSRRYKAGDKVSVSWHPEHMVDITPHDFKGAN